MTRTLVTLLAVTLSHVTLAQTFFEAADGTGVISFSKTQVSQIKASLSSTAITYGFYGMSRDARADKRLIFQAEAKVKPNDDGIGTILKGSKLQPSVGVSGAFGYRLNDILFDKRWSVLDIYLKPEYAFTTYTLYDTTRIPGGEKAQYEKRKHTLGANLLVNIGVSFSKTNLFVGVQLGVYGSDNTDTLKDVTLQTIRPAGSVNQFVVSDSEEAKRGVYQKATKQPFKIDLVFDPNIKLKDGDDRTTMKLGFFGYWRTDLSYQPGRNRIGAGLCLLGSSNPSKIFSSIGYEFPKFGNGLTDDDKTDNKGIAFASIGYTISKD
ncbi:MAG: hypothetical protein WDO14_24270 [Bacteroidota bacterium]